MNRAIWIVILGDLKNALTVHIKTPSPQTNTNLDAAMLRLNESVNAYAGFLRGLPKTVEFIDRWNMFVGSIGAGNPNSVALAQAYNSVVAAIDDAIAEASNG